MLLPMLQRFLVSVLYRPLFNLTCGVISWQFSNFEALVIVHSCNLSPPRRLFEWGGPPNPPLPRQGWMSPLRMGGPPKPPHSCARSECCLFEWGDPQTPHSRARGGCRLFEWGDPQTPHFCARGGCCIYAKNSIPGHTWSPPGNTWSHPGNIWQHLVTSNCQHADRNCDLYSGATFKI